MRLLPWVRWIVPLIGYVVSVTGLRSATTTLAGYGARVPDLLPIEGFPLSYAEAFDRLAGPAAAAYLDALWRFDLLFPASYAALLFQAASRSGRWRYAAPVAAACDFAENGVALAIVRHGLPLEPLYAALDVGKFALLAVAALAATWSALVWARNALFERWLLR